MKELAEDWPGRVLLEEEWMIWIHCMCSLIVQLGLIEIQFALWGYVGSAWIVGAGLWWGLNNDGGTMKTVGQSGEEQCTHRTAVGNLHVAIVCNIH